MKLWPSLLLAGIASLLPFALPAAQVSADAERLVATLDARDVEHHWPAGQHVHWETGVPDGRPESASRKRVDEYTALLN